MYMTYTTIKKVLLCAAFFVFSAMTGFAQCKSAIKKALPKLVPYQFDGQGEYKVTQGKSIELISTFTAGDSFRILFVAPDNMGNSIFNIYEKKGSKRKLIFTNQMDEDFQYWDIKSKSTQDYVLEMIVPPPAIGVKPISGCVAILIGIKE
jgi:hypothetical protein